jgi:hypothetical protein
MLVMKSTNVRFIVEAAMPNRPIPENTARTLAVTLVGWAGAVAWAAADGIFARLDPVVALALAAFATVYAAGTYALDADVREYLHRTPRTQWLAAAASADLGAALAIATALGQADPLAAFTHEPFALVAYFGIPLAAVANLAALTAPAAPRLRSRPARSPGAKPAAP